MAETRDTGARRSGAILLAALGTAATLAVWTALGTDPEVAGAHLTSWPAQVFGGRGTALAIEVELSQPGTLRASFTESPSETRGDDVHVVEIEQELAAGAHTLEVDVGGAATAWVEARIATPEPGARLSWRLRLDGRELEKDSITLDAPARRGRAFFLDFDFEETVAATARRLLGRR